jgi:hypothetical protein
MKHKVKIISDLPSFCMELLDLEGSELAVQPYINSSIPYNDQVRAKILKKN